MPAAPESVLLFNALPGACLLLSPELLIEAASDDYLAAALATREQLIGRFVFDAFLDNSAAPEAHSTRNLRASLDQVMATGQSHTMAQQHYDVPDATRPGHFLERHWLPTNRPVLDAEGRVAYIIHAVVDVTAQHTADHILRASQVAEEVARAEAEAERQRLYQVLMRLPANIALLRGPEHVYDLVNAEYERLFPARTTLGRTIREVIPDIEGQGFYELFDRVYETGESFYEAETEAWADFAGTGEPQRRYYRTSFEPIRNAQGQVTEVLNFAVDVTAQVEARQQVEQLNAELEVHVQARTQEALALQTDLLEATQRQVQVRESFYQVFEQTPAAVSLLRGPTYRFEYVNPVYQQVFAGRQLVGHDFAEALPDAAAQGYLAMLDGVYRTGETFFGAEVPFVSEQPDAPAHTVYFNFTYQAYREHGEIVGISTFALDVTEQVLARQEREAQRRELEQLFMQAPAPIVILDGPDLVFQLVNPAYQQIFPGRALQGKPLLAALPELAGTPIPELFRRVYQTGEPVTVHELPLWMARHEGHALEEIYWTFTYQARRAADGQIDGVRVFAHDVTESVRTRQASEAGARQLRLLTDALPVLIGYLDRERRYQFANEAYRTWFNQDPAELLGRKVRDIVGEKAYAATSGYMDRALAGERFDFEATMPYREGFTRHIRTSYIPDVQQGIVQGFYTLVTDVTEQVEARRQVESLNQELAAINEELTASNEELGDSNTQLTRTNVDLDNFIYTASHDLKAPISNIEGLLLALEHEMPAAGRVGDVPLMLTMMQAATERFKRTIEHLTEVSRLQKEHGQATAPVPLAAVVDAVRLDLLPLIQQSQAQLDVQVPASLTVTFSEKNLRSVVYNLLSNALKYRHPDRVPQISLHYQPQQDYQVLEVQDNGLGMDLAQGQDKLFAMFQRLHTHVEGTGIGLYMVKRIVENAGGRIEVESQPGRGSTFRVYFLR